jgi:hypothetical protein
VADGLAAGLPLKEIRAQIEKKYPGDPTNTPPIE